MGYGVHETAVAWIRRRETVTQTRKPWTETPEQYGRRLRGICQYINDDFDVENLCRELPDRLDDPIEGEGLHSQGGCATSSLGPWLLPEAQG